MICVFRISRRSWLSHTTYVLQFVTHTCACGVFGFFLHHMWWWECQCYSTELMNVCRSWLDHSYLTDMSSYFLFSYPVMLLLPMAVPAAQSWPVGGKAARLSSATTASKYGIQIRHAIWPVSRGHRLFEYGPSTLQVSVTDKNLDQV